MWIDCYSVSVSISVFDLWSFRLGDLRWKTIQLSGTFWPLMTLHVYQWCDEIGLYSFHSKLGENVNQAERLL